MKITDKLLRNLLSVCDKESPEINEAITGISEDQQAMIAAAANSVILAMREAMGDNEPTSDDLRDTVMTSLTLGLLTGITTSIDDLMGPIDFKPCPPPQFEPIEMIPPSRLEIAARIVHIPLHKEQIPEMVSAALEIADELIKQAGQADAKEEEVQG